AYERLGRAKARPGLFVASYFGHLGEALPVLASTPVEAIGVDLVRGGLDGLEALAGKTVVAGVVSGRDVWLTPPGRAGRALAAVREDAARVVVSTSCSLLRVPYDVTAETDLDPALRARLAFAEQKVTEVVAFARTTPRPGPGPGRGPRESTAGAVADGARSPYPVRAAAQAAHLRLPPLPVTTIGSFPQTGELRAARAAVAAGTLTAEEYERRVEAEIERVIRLQERLGLDVLVHGEPER